MPIWYTVSDLDTSRTFYTEKLGFPETYLDRDGRWGRLERDGMEHAPAAGDPAESGVAHVDVSDVKAERARLAAEGVGVGVVFELHGEMRLLDVFDPDGNRIQLAQELSGG